MKIGDFTITSLEYITAFDLSGDYLFTLDELQNASIASTEEEQEITGRGGRRISTIKKNKGASLTGTNGLVSGGLLGAQTGYGVEADKSVDVEWRDYVKTKTSTTAELTNAPKVASEDAPAATDIEGAFVKNADGSIGAELTVTDLAKSGTGASAVWTVTFSDDEIATGTEIVVFYKRTVTSKQYLENDSEEFSKTCQVYVDGEVEDKCGNTYHIQFYFPKATFKGEFTIEMGDNQSVHNFEATAETGGCASGKSSLLWTYTVFN